MEKFLQTVHKWLQKIRKTPVIGRLFEDLDTMTELVRDWLRGLYDSVPRATVFALVAALIYAVSPIDLLLDVIPLAGFLDDAAVIGLMLDLGLARDLMQYREWKRLRRNEAIESYRQTLVSEYLKQLSGRDLAAAYLTEDRQILLLLSRPGDTARPLSCASVRVPIAEQKLSELELESWDDLGAFYSQVFRDDRFPWSHLGRQPFRPEYTGGIDEAFIVQ